jgi:hypothetical protein
MLKGSTRQSTMSATDTEPLSHEAAVNATSIAERTR